MEVPPTPAPGPSGPLSGGQGPSGPLSGGQGPSGPWSGQHDVVRRLADVERQLEALGQRVGDLEASLHEAVAEEVRGGTAELRRAITELGRRLVQDLPHELARHRDTIVAELRPPPPPPPPPVEPEEPLPAPEAEVDEMTEVAVATVVDTPEMAARRRASRLRRRHG